MLRAGHEAEVVILQLSKGAGFSPRLAFAVGARSSVALDLRRPPLRNAVPSPSCSGALIDSGPSASTLPVGRREIAAARTGGRRHAVDDALRGVRVFRVSVELLRPGTFASFDFSVI